jgi:hypothetical protein
MGKYHNYGKMFKRGRNSTIVFYADPFRESDWYWDILEFKREK